MSDLQDKNQNLVIFDFADETVVADAIFPQFAKSSTLQGLSHSARVFFSRNASRKKLQDALALLGIEFAEVLVGRLREFNPPGHDVSSFRRAE